MTYLSTRPRAPAGSGQMASGKGARMGRFGMALAASFAGAFLLSAMMTSPANAQEPRIISVDHRNTAQVAGSGGVPGAIITAYDAEIGEEIGDTAVNANGTWGIVFPQTLERGTAIRLDVPNAETGSATSVPVILANDAQLPPQINYYSAKSISGYAPPGRSVQVLAGGSAYNFQSGSDGSWTTGSQMPLYNGEEVMAYMENDGSITSPSSSVDVGEERPNPPYNIVLNSWNASGSAEEDEVIDAYLSDGTHLGADPTDSDGTWSINFNADVTGQAVYFSATQRVSIFSIPKRTSSVYAIRQENAVDIATPVITSAFTTSISGTEATPNTHVWVHVDHGSSVSSYYAPVQADGSWTAVPDDPLEVGTAVYAFAEQNQPDFLNSQPSHLAIVGSETAGTVNYMPYIYFVLDSSESMGVFEGHYALETQITTSVLEKLNSISVLDAGYGKNSNANISKHISASQTVQGAGGYIENTDYNHDTTIPGVFDPNIFNGPPPKYVYFSKNSDMNSLVSELESWKYATGLSINLDGFVWGVQTIYNTPASATHPQALGMYDDVKAAMVIALTDGVDNGSNEPGLKNAFDKNNTCDLITNALDGKGVKFQPYWVPISGLNGTPTIDSSFLPSCFNREDTNTYSGDPTDVDTTANTILKAIIDLGNKVPR